MKSLDSLDQKICETLAEHDSKLQKEIEVIDRGEGYFDLLMASIHGRQAWITYYIYGLSAVTLAVFIYCLTGYLASTSVDSSLDWALGLIACMFIFTVVKVIAFEQMLKFEMLREMKRIELRPHLPTRPRPCKPEKKQPCRVGAMHREAGALALATSTLLGST